MAELMGVCGAAPEAISSMLDCMQFHISRAHSMPVDRWEGAGLGLLRFHHGAINPRRQPAFSRDGTFLIAMDGKAFLRESVPSSIAAFRERLHNDNNDADVLLRLYEVEGESAFRSLSGSYSALLYWPQSRRLLLVTDPFSSRPVFYCWRGEVLAFGSRFNALIASGLPVSGRLDMRAVMQFFTWQRAQFTDTFYQNVRAMLPGSVLEFSGGRLSQRRYLRPRYNDSPTGFDALADELAETLRSAAQKLTSGPFRKGVLLSGGLDSRTLAAAAERRMTACTVFDRPNRELRTAKAVARAKGWPHLVLRRRQDHYVRILDEAVELCGGMNRFDHCHFVGLLEPVRFECDVVFNEDAMDALLKGHYWHRRLSVRGIRVPVPWTASFDGKGIEEQILRLDSLSLFPSRPWLLFREPWRSRYRDILYASIREQLADAQTQNPYNMVEHVAGLASLGRAIPGVRCVRTHLEYGALSLDSDLLDLAVRTPVRYRTGGQLLCEALRRLDGRLYAIPHANTGLRVDVPAVGAWAFQMAAQTRLRALKKLHRLAPTDTDESWPDRAELLRTPAMRRILDSTLGNPDAIVPDIFNLEHVKTLLREHMSRRKDHMRMLLCLLTFGRWFKEHGPADVG